MFQKFMQKVNRWEYLKYSWRIKNKMEEFIVSDIKTYQKVIVINKVWY